MPHDEGNIVFEMSLQSSLLMPHDEGKHFLNEREMSSEISGGTFE